MLETIYNEGLRIVVIFAWAGMLYGLYALPRDLYRLVRRWRARRWRARERARQRAE